MKDWPNDTYFPVFRDIFFQIAQNVLCNNLVPLSSRAFSISMSIQSTADALPYLSIAMAISISETLFHYHYLHYIDIPISQCNFVIFFPLYCSEPYVLNLV